jgi:hypothetical protein
VKNAALLTRPARRGLLKSRDEGRPGKIFDGLRRVEQRAGARRPAHDGRAMGGGRGCPPENAGLVAHSPRLEPGQHVVVELEADRNLNIHDHGFSKFPSLSSPRQRITSSVCNVRTGRQLFKMRPATPPIQHLASCRASPMKIESSRSQRPTPLTVKTTLIGSRFPAGASANTSRLMTCSTQRRGV